MTDLPVPVSPYSLDCRYPNVAPREFYLVADRWVQERVYRLPMVRDYYRSDRTGVARFIIDERYNLYTAEQWLREFLDALYRPRQSVAQHIRAILAKVINRSAAQ